MATFPSRPVSRKRNSSTDEVAKANSNTVAGSRVPGYRPLAAQEQLHGQTPYTPAGNPIGDNQNSITADANRPVPLQDYHLIEKLAHQNPERTVHARRYLEIHQNLKLSGENYEDDSQDNHRVGSRIFRTCFHRDANTENDYDSIQNSDRGSASVDDRGNLCKRPVAELAGPMVAGCF
jgi:hypothetical protein